MAIILLIINKSNDNYVYDIFLSTHIRQIDLKSKNPLQVKLAAGFWEYI